MAEHHRTGEKVVKEGDGGSSFEVTCVEGEHNAHMAAPFAQTV